MNISKDSAFYRFAAWDHSSDFEIKDGCTLYLAALGNAATVLGHIILTVSLITIAGFFTHYMRGIETDISLASPVSILVHGVASLVAAGAIGYGLFRLARKHCQSVKIV